MRSQLSEALALKHTPVAVLLTDTKPEGAAQLKQGSWACVAAMLKAATKGRTIVFDRKTSGCPGGGTGLGFGNCYAGFPIDRLLSTGGKAELEGGQTFDMGGRALLREPRAGRPLGGGLALPRGADRVHRLQATRPGRGG